MLAKVESLDKIQIAALRKADDISFHRLATGESFIRATKRPKVTAADPFAREVGVEIHCDSRLSDYENPRIGDAEWMGFEFCMAAQYDEEWKTVASLLKPGDCITLDWQRGVWNSPVLAEQGIVGDRLSLRIIRMDRKPTLVFTVGHSCGLDNTARMIRRA